MVPPRVLEEISVTVLRVNSAQPTTAGPGAAAGVEGEPGNRPSNESEGENITECGDTPADCTGGDEALGGEAWLLPGPTAWGAEKRCRLGTDMAGLSSGGEAVPRAKEGP